MKVIVPVLLVPILSVLQGNCSACFGSEELDRQCSRYCYDVVKPLLGQARSWYEQPRENQAVTLKELDKRLEEHVKKVEKQVDINNAFTKSFLATLEMNILEKVESSKNSFKKLQTDFQNLNSVLQTQKQFIDSTVDRVENVFKTIDEKLLKQGKRIESGLTMKLETLNNKLDTALKTQNCQPKVMRKQFKKIGSKYYYISKDKDANWHDADVLCRKFGGNLVTFESEEEFNAVKIHLKSYKLYWTSLNDADKEGHFVSISTGKEAPYINWDKGEPNNMGRGENCVHVTYLSDRYVMNDRDCSQKIGYICEAGKLDTEFQYRLDQNLNDALDKQNREINNALKTREEKFNQQVDMIQKQIKTNAENVYTRLEPLMGKTENTKTTLDKVEKVMKAVDEKLLKQCQANGSGLTEKLDNLNNKMDTALKTQNCQPKVMRKQFEKIGSKYYYISKDMDANWHDADVLCRKFGGNLVTFESEEEFNAVKIHLKSYKLYWTSLNDADKEGHFVSISTGKEAPYVNWDKGEPNNMGRGENCVHVTYLSDRYVMNDRDCSQKIGYICEAGKLDTEFQYRLDQNLNDALDKQNREINNALKTREEKFNQQVDMIQKQIKTNAENVYTRLEPLMGKTENTKTTLDKVEKVMKAVDEKLLKQCQANGSGLTEKLDNLNNKMDTALKTQNCQPKVMRKQFEKIGSKYYYISKDMDANWHDADVLCRKFGGNLVTFESEEEFNAVKIHLKSYKLYWTSLNDADKEGHFVSISTGKEAPYINWDKGEPNNMGRGENCVHVTYLSDRYVMNDRDCSQKIGYICEAGKLDTEFQYRLDQNLNDALDKQNREINNALKTREEKFNQQVDMIQKQIKTNAENVYSRLEPLMGKTENTKTTLDKVEKVMKAVDEKLLKQGKTIESGLTEKLDNLNNKMDTALKTQNCQPKVMWKQFEKIGSKYYYISKDMDANWHDADVLCRKFGGNLVTFESEEEFNAVKIHLKSYKLYWTSLNDADKEGHFVSVSTGKEAPYINWHKGEPNNMDMGENCVHVTYLSDRYAMNDRDCSQKIGYICEAGKLDTEFQYRLDQNLNDALDKQNREINNALKTREEKFNQQVDMIQKQIKTNAENVYSTLEPLMGKTENTKTTLDKVEKVMKAVDEKLLKQCQTNGSGLTAKLDNLNNKMDTVVKKQGDQAKLGVFLSQFQKMGSKYYISVDLKKNWYDADKICKKIGANLINFESKKEYDTVISHLESPSDYWTSLSDIKKEGYFVSITTGKEAPYVNWDEGEPNNLGGIENCVNLRYISDKYVMNDRDCSHEIGFICKAAELLV